MEDQVSQNAEIERRAWDQLTETEQAAALVELGKYMLGRHPAWMQEAAAMAILYGLMAEVDLKQRLPASPIEWGALSEVELARRLMDVADWSDVTAPEQTAYLRESCQAVAEDLVRSRRPEREGRER